MSVIHGPTLLTDLDIYLFKAGRHFKLYEKLGSHIIEVNGQKGVYFAIWAPNANSVHVIGDFNGWNHYLHPLAPRWDHSGIFEGFIPKMQKGDVYKYFIISKVDNYSVEKADPFACFGETPPKTASIVEELSYVWHDDMWMQKQNKINDVSSALSIYEMHIGSWKRKDGRFLSFKELAKELLVYIRKMGFTHVEFLPALEHPFYGSWGYQSLSYFAPTSRYGSHKEFMELIDTLHQNNIGVILDWVPSHFPSDQHGLSFFDGTCLYEHQDVKKGLHPDWNTLIFNYGRKEVKSFLISSAFFWAEKYHVDGLRSDAISSMLYLDYSRKEGEWIPNMYGGNENIEAIDFLRELNKAMEEHFPSVMMIAEESTAWPMVTHPVEVGGLGFKYKWNMGWMNDTLRYFSKDPVHRKYHQNELAFSLWYAFSENFILPLSHDEVVYQKGSLLNKMPGDEWQKHANLRLLFGYFYTHPGKKLLFMGGEIGQKHEWHHDNELAWYSLQDKFSFGVNKWIEDLNNFYKQQPALYEIDNHADGFEWIDFSDYENSIICYLRKAKNGDDNIIITCNFTPVCRYDYRIGVPFKNNLKEILNSDDIKYGGSGVVNDKIKVVDDIPFHNRPHSVSITLPPLAISVFKKVNE
jgi:1,4-alpha-glucan branching enzyme